MCTNDKVWLEEMGEEFKRIEQVLHLSNKDIENALQMTKKSKYWSKVKGGKRKLTFKEAICFEKYILSTLDEIFCHDEKVIDKYALKMKERFTDGEAKDKVSEQIKKIEAKIGNIQINEQEIKERINKEIESLERNLLKYSKLTIDNEKYKYLRKWYENQNEPNILIIYLLYSINGSDMHYLITGKKRILKIKKSYSFRNSSKR